MREIKGFMIVLGILAVFLVFSWSVSALSLSPAQSTNSYVSGKIDSGSFTIFNNDNTPLKITILPSSEYDSVTNITNETLLSGKSMDVKYSITEPKEISYGNNCYPITVKSIRSNNPAGVITAQLSLVYKYCIFVPYPGEYGIIKSLSYGPKPAVPGQKTNIIINAESLGTLDINGAYVNGIINCGDLSMPFKTPKKDILSQSTATLNTSVIIGKTNSDSCNVDAVLHYGSKTRKKTGKIIISKKDIYIVNLKRDFTQGQIQQFYVIAVNKWNKQIEDLQAVLTIATPDGNVSIKTVPDSIKPLETKTFFGTYTLKFLPVGQYNATLEMKFTNPSQYKEIKRYTIDVVPYQTSSLSPITGNANAGFNSNISSLTFITIFVSVILGILVALILFRKKKNFDSEL